MTWARRALAVLLSLALASACGTPKSQHEIAAIETAPVDLTLVGTDGRRFALSQLRGKPLLLFVFTTYDDVSQLALTPLTSFLAQHPDLPAIGIAAQPGPAALLPLYRDALDVRIPLAYEADPQLVAGDSMLGRIETVPSYVLLDARGRIAARHSGPMTHRELEGFVDPVLP
jgi:hypothetical protein